MQTVDFAAHNLIQRLGIDSRAQIHRPWPALMKAMGGNPKLESLDSWPTNFQTDSTRQTIQNGDLLLTWGDFQLGHDYQTQSAKRYRQIQAQHGNRVSEEEALDWSFDYFLLKSALEKEIDTACFGTTLFQNSMRDWAHSRYRNAIENYFDSCVFAKFRDPYSSWSHSKLTNTSDQGNWGIDCALLNTREELLSIPATDVTSNLTRGGIGVYLGRSSKRFSKLRFAKFLRLISKKFEAPLHWIPWNQFTGGKLFSKRPRLLNSPLVNIESFPKNHEVKAGDIFHLLDSLKLVVTDTYHVAINAMTMRIPVLCIYEPSPKRSRDANMGFRESWRDKRALLFTSTNQSDFLMSANDLASNHYCEKKVEHLVSITSDQATMKNWKQWLDLELETQRTQLETMIRSRLNL